MRKPKFGPENRPGSGRDLVADNEPSSGTVIARGFLLVAVVGFLVGLLAVDPRLGQGPTEQRFSQLLGSAVAEPIADSELVVGSNTVTVDGRDNGAAGTVVVDGRAVNAEPTRRPPVGELSSGASDPRGNDDPGGDDNAACSALFDGQLSPDWHPAPWSFSSFEIASEVEIEFPQYWGALSFQSHGRPIDISQCVDLRITMASSEPASRFVIQVQTVDGIAAGETVVTISQEPGETVVPLETFELVDGKATRVSILNQAEVENVKLTVSTIKFTN